MDKWKVKPRRNWNWQATITVIVAGISVVIGAATFWLQNEERIAQRTAEQGARFSIAIERLESGSPVIRLGALFELELLVAERQDFKEQLVRTLVPIIRQGIENPGLTAISMADIDSDLLNTLPYGLRRPDYYIFYAAELVTNLRNETNLNFNVEAAIDRYVIQGDTVSLIHLRAYRRDFREFDFSGTELWNSNFQGSGLRFANFEGAGLRRANFSNASLMDANFEGAYLFLADFRNADLTDANFQNAYLRGAENLTVEQLLEARIDEETQLDDHLADDPRIQARIAELADQTPVN